MTTPPLSDDEIARLATLAREKMRPRTPLKNLSVWRILERAIPELRATSALRARVATLEDALAIVTNSREANARRIAALEAALGEACDRIEREANRIDASSCEHYQVPDGMPWVRILSDLRALVARGQPPAPVDMLLFCPACRLQHIDEPHGDWTNPPHRSHECQGCGHIWRPADVATNGVRAIKTRSSRDSGQPSAPVERPLTVAIALIDERVRAGTHVVDVDGSRQFWVLGEHMIQARSMFDCQWLKWYPWILSAADLADSSRVSIVPAEVTRGG